MTYNLENFEIIEAQGARISGQNGGNKYLSCTAINPHNRFAAPHRIAIFHEQTVAYYASILPKSKGGELEDTPEWKETDIPMNDRIFRNGQTVEYDLGGEYCRKYNSAIVDADGREIPGKGVGDFIKNQNGFIKHFSKISVFCQYDYVREERIDMNTGLPMLDKDGMPIAVPVRGADGQLMREWVEGWAPHEVGERMKALLVPYDPSLEDNVEAIASLDDDDEAPEA